MARKNNFLLGRGEQLTGPVLVPTGGSAKNPPYTFQQAQARVELRLGQVTAALSKLPSTACPDDEAVAVVTLHPRYLSKSEHPDELFRAVGLRPVGSRLRRVSPEAWGVKSGPKEAFAQDLFVAGTRSDFSRWGAAVGQWQPSTTGAKYLGQIEDITPFEASRKIKGVNPDATGKEMLEVVLHDAVSPRVLDGFLLFARTLGCTVLADRLRRTGSLGFVPVRAPTDAIGQLAKFQFVRVARGMPRLRPLRPSLVREGLESESVTLPTDGPLVSDVRAVIFDGGLPSSPDLSKWVRSIDAPGVGKADPEHQLHGLAVTSALLFGPLTEPDASRPMCSVDHVRVLDVETDEGVDLEYYDVLDRIESYMKDRGDEYEFVNISLGPQMPLDDDDVTAWTATLDDLFVDGTHFVTVAAGNDGERDAQAGLNRIQPPADGVNLLSVGASDREGAGWKRARYSCVGPGRCPGVVKPDGVIFGGSAKAPFLVLDAEEPTSAIGTSGTSFAAPFALRAAVSIRAQLGPSVKPLLSRALMIHRAEGSSAGALHEAGWGRFESDAARLITCEDHEAIAVYQGELPVGRHLRARVPLPVESVENCFLTLAATLLISPETEPENPGCYTKSGVEVVFRPNVKKYTSREGALSKHPKSAAFFNKKNMYGAAEYEFREDGHKWEPCLRGQRRFRAVSLDQPCFDIYYHRREGGTAPTSTPDPIPYALVVTVSAPKVSDLYDRVVRSYPNVLVPIQPRVQVPVRV